MLPGWSLHDFGNSFHLNEGSGQVNGVVYTLFSGSIEKYVKQLKETNSNIFNIVTESKENIDGIEYIILKCRYEENDIFERTVYFTNTKMENINLSIETDLYNTDAPFATRNYSLSDLFEKI